MPQEKANPQQQINVGKELKAKREEVGKELEAKSEEPTAAWPRFRYYR